jgi:hypothetical protein
MPVISRSGRTFEESPGEQPRADPSSRTLMWSPITASAASAIAAEYKFKHRAECDAFAGDGDKGAPLRREGLYSSHVFESHRVSGAGPGTTRRRAAWRDLGGPRPNLTPLKAGKYRASTTLNKLGVRDPWLDQQARRISAVEPANTPPRSGRVFNGGAGYDEWREGLRVRTIY